MSEKEEKKGLSSEAILYIQHKFIKKVYTVYYSIFNQGLLSGSSLTEISIRHFLSHTRVFM